MLMRVFALLPLALLVSASHLEARDQCKTGSLQCCNSVQKVNDLLKSWGLVDVAASVDAVVGLACAPITVLGEGIGCTAAQQPACCTDNTFSSEFVNFGCSSINVNE